MKNKPLIFGLIGCVVVFLIGGLIAAILLGKGVMDAIKKEADNVSKKTNVEKNVDSDSNDSSDSSDDLADDTRTTTTVTTAPTKTTTPTKSSTTSSDACKILTKEEAATILGANVKDATPSNSTTTSSCTYATDDSAGLDNFGVVTFLVMKTDPVSAKQNFESAKSSAYGGQYEVVKGLDAEAYWAPSLSQLSLYKGDSWMILTVISGKGESKDMSIAAAKYVLD